MKSIFEFLSDDDAFEKWRAEEYDGRYILDHVRKATMLAMETELSEAQKQYITKYVLEDKSMAEIAGIYGMSEYTVSRVIHAGKVKLMHALRYTAPWLLNAEIEKTKSKVVARKLQTPL